LSALRTCHIYPPGNIPGTHFCKSLSRTQDHSAAGNDYVNEKFPMTPSGIEPAAFRLVGQCLTQMRVPSLPTVSWTTLNVDAVRPSSTSVGVCTQIFPTSCGRILKRSAFTLTTRVVPREQKSAEQPTANLLQN